MHKSPPLYRPRHPCLLFGTKLAASGDLSLIFRTPLLFGFMRIFYMPIAFSPKTSMATIKSFLSLALTFGPLSSCSVKELMMGLAGGGGGLSECLRLGEGFTDGGGGGVEDFGLSMIT